MPLLHALADNYNDNSLNGTLWGVYTDGGGAVTEASQRINLAPGAGVASSNALLYANAAYDLRGSGLALKVAMTTVVGTGTELALETNATNRYRLYMSTGDNLLTFQRTAAGVTTTVWSVTYSPTNHAYLFACEQGGTVYAFVSADCLNWTNPAGAGVGATAAGAINHASVTPKFNCFVYQSTAAPGATTIDWVNATGTTPAAPTAPAVSGVAWDRATVSVTGNANSLWYTVERRVTAGGAWGQVGDEVMAPLMPYREVRFIPSPFTTSWRVTARNGGGASAAGAVVSAAIPDYAPPAPTRYVTPTGAGVGDGTSPAAPISVARAWQVAQPGDCIQLANGDYNAADSWYINTPYGGGSATAWLTWRAESQHGARLTIDAGANPADTTGVWVFERAITNVTLWGFVFDGNNKVSNGILFKSNVRMRVFGCRAVNCGASGFATNNDGSGNYCDYIAFDRCEGNHIGNYPGTLYGWGSFISLHKHTAADGYAGIHSWVNRCGASGIYDGSANNTDGNFGIVDYPLTSDGGQNAPYCVWSNCLGYMDGGRGLHVKNGSQVIWLNPTLYKNALDIAVLNGSSGNNGEMILAGGTPDVAGVNRNNHVYNALVRNWERQGRIASDEVADSTLHTGNRWRRVLYATDDVTPELRLASAITADTNQIRRATGDNLGFISTPAVDPSATGQQATAPAPWALGANDFRLATTSPARALGVDPVADLAGVVPRQVLADLQLVAYGDYAGTVRAPGAWDVGAFQVDLTPPVISNVQVPAATITTTGATVTWQTDGPADGLVEYGTSHAYGSSTPLAPALVTAHAISLTGLTPGTAYHVRVTSKDAAGNAATSGDVDFSTAAGDTTPPVLGPPSVDTITTTSAVVRWTTDEPADSQAEVGVSHAYGALSPLDSALVTTHAVTLTGLTPATTYHARARSRDAAGNLGLSVDVDFFTNPLLRPRPPAAIVEIAFASDPGQAPVWTDVTSWAQEIDIARGRQYELDAVQAASATLVLDNRDRRFDPTHAGGPYAPNVRVLRRLRIRAVWQAVSYDQFVGYIQAYTPAIAPGNGDATMRLAAVDGMKLLANANLNQSFPAQRTDVRIAAVLDAIGWPAADRALSQGQIVSQATTLTGVSALAHLQRVVDDEAGFLFLDKSGRVAFQERASRLRPTVTSLVTLGDGGGAEQLYVDQTFSFDDTRIINEARVTRTGGTEQRAADATSQARYLLRSRGASGTLHERDGDAYGLAAYLVGRQREPGLRAGSIELDAEANPAVLWPQVLGRELGDRLTVRRRPPGGGAAIDQPSHLEGARLRWTAEGGAWAATWEISPADTGQYWLLGHPTYGLLGSTTRLGY